MPKTDLIATILVNKPEESFRKILVKVADDDLSLVKQVFPEMGFTTYFPAFAYKLLADKLREEGIASVIDRNKSKCVATLQELVQNVRIVEVAKPTPTRRRSNRKSVRVGRIQDVK
ncbi:MAG: hypothetical protein HC840_01290 [Leptolyngbyaceae cyanobacterium RM2_2_4]|nr:hypothetical protein [Leptolyngbyaceae cyanobacterium RM2_2_4]